MRTFSQVVSRVHAAAARHVLSAVVAVTAISACSGGGSRNAAPITEPVTNTVALSVSGSGTGSGKVMSTPAGIDCDMSAGAASGTCTARYRAGTVVTLETVPSPTSVFVAFSGDCALATCQTTMEAPRIVTATFVPNLLSVVAQAASRGGGRVVSSPAGIDCILNGAAAGSGACTAGFPLNTVVTLQQEPVAGAVFQAWGSACVGNPCSLTLNGQRTVDVTYRMPEPPGTLTVSGGGSGTGTVISAPDGIACAITAGVTSGTCSAVFAAGMVIALNATSSGTGTFAGFSGNCSGQTCSAAILLGTVSTVAATFMAAVPPSIPSILTISPSPASRGSGVITSVPAGITCTVSHGVTSGVCSVNFTMGTIVTLTQTPQGNSLFQGWSGDCVGNPCQLTLTQPRIGEVTYRVPPPGIVTVAGTGTGNGAVTSSPSGIACTVTAGVTSGICSTSFDAGSSVTLIGGASGGDSFDGFSGTCTGGACVIPVVSGVTSAVNVGFTAAPQRLIVTPGSGSAGSGVITSVPAGISCVVSGSSSSGTCNALFLHNTVVTLQQSTTGNAVFNGWAGDCTTDPCQVAMSQGRTALVIFRTQGLVISGGGSGTGTITSSPSGISCVITAGVVGGTCSATFPPNTLVTLTSTPSGINSFSGYTGACNGPTCSVTMVTGAMTAVTAQFAAPPTLTMTAVSGSEGGGTITSAPLGIACTLTYIATNGSCVNAYALNTSVMLTQTPSTGSVFVYWLGACSGSANSCTVALTQSRSVQALYRLAVPGSVTVNSGAGAGSGSVSSSPGGLACSIANGVKGGICRAIFPVGSTLSLIPRASSGSTFTGFSGSCSGMTCVLTVPENGDISVTANFIR